MYNVIRMRHTMSVFTLLPSAPSLAGPRPLLLSVQRCTNELNPWGRTPLMVYHRAAYEF